MPTKQQEKKTKKKDMLYRGHKIHKLKHFRWFSTRSLFIVWSMVIRAELIVTSKSRTTTTNTHGKYGCFTKYQTRIHIRLCCCSKSSVFSSGEKKLHREHSKWSTPSMGKTENFYSEMTEHSREQNFHLDLAPRERQKLLLLLTAKKNHYEHNKIYIHFGQIKQTVRKILSSICKSIKHKRKKRS